MMPVPFIRGLSYFPLACAIGHNGIGCTRGEWAAEIYAEALRVPTEGVAMDWHSEYTSKQLSVEDLFDRHLTGGGQRIYAGGLHVPTTIINALIDRGARKSLCGIELCGAYERTTSFETSTLLLSSSATAPISPAPTSAPAWQRGRIVAHIPVHFDTNRMLREQAFDYAVVQMTRRRRRLLQHRPRRIRAGGPRRSAPHHRADQRAPAARVRRLPHLPCPPNRRLRHPG